MSLNEIFESKLIKISDGFLHDPKRRENLNEISSEKCNPSKKSSELASRSALHLPHLCHLADTFLSHFMFALVQKMLPYSPFVNEIFTFFIFFLLFSIYSAMSRRESIASHLISYIDFRNVNHTHWVHQECVYCCWKFYMKFPPSASSISTISPGRRLPLAASFPLSSRLIHFCDTTFCNNSGGPAPEEEKFVFDVQRERVANGKAEKSCRQLVRSEKNYNKNFMF